MPAFAGMTGFVFGIVFEDPFREALGVTVGIAELFVQL
jgi:hypothetical protein